MADVTKKEIEDRLKDYILNMCSAINSKGKFSHTGNWEEINGNIKNIPFQLDAVFDSVLNESATCNGVEYGRLFMNPTTGAIDVDAINLIESFVAEQIDARKDSSGKCKEYYKGWTNGKGAKYVFSGKTATNASYAFNNIGATWFGKLDTSNSTSLSYAFSASVLRGVGVFELDLTKCTNASYMLRATTLSRPISITNMSSVQNMHRLVCEVSNASQKISGIDFTSVTSCGQWCYNNTSSRGKYEIYFIDNSIMDSYNLPPISTSRDDYHGFYCHTCLSWGTWLRALRCLHDYSADTEYSADKHPKNCHNLDITDSFVESLIANNSDFSESDWNDLKQQIEAKRWTIS